MGGEEWLPERKGLPVCRQFHFRLESGIKRREQVGEAGGQRGIRLDDLDEVNQKDERVVDAPLVCIALSGLGKCLVQ